MNLVLIDWIIFAVIILSTLLSIISGFVKESLSLINWFIAFTVAKLFYEDVAKIDTFNQLPENYRIPLAIIALFIVTFVIGKITIAIVVHILRKTDGSLSMTDRLLGMCFGALRGMLFVCAIFCVFKIIFFLGFFSFIQKLPFWADSVFIPEIDKVIVWFFDKIDINSVMNNVSDTVSTSLTSSLNPSVDPSTSEGMENLNDSLNSGIEDEE